MKNLKTTTWVLIGLVVVTGALVTTLLVLMPEDLPGAWRQHWDHHLSEGEEGASFRERMDEKFKDLTPEQQRELRWKLRRFGHGFRRGGFHHGGFRGVHPFRGGLIGGLLVLGGVVAVIVFIRRRGKGDSALDTLEQQYAEGKISEQEYNQKKSVLREED
jgi:uncharacterized membrane protein